LDEQMPLKEGKPMKQSLAIAYSLKRKAKKMARGGEMKAKERDIPEASMCEHGGPEMCAMGCYDEGGSVTPSPSPSPTTGYEAAGQALKTDKDNPGLKSIQAAFAEGGDTMGDPMLTEAEEANMEDSVRNRDMFQDQDMVDRIMAKRQMRREMMSKGGVVSNDTKITSGFMPNQFDDLVLRGDDFGNFEETGANEGDNISDKLEDEDRKDIVSRIMRSRAKKDRNPMPA